MYRTNLSPQNLKKSRRLVCSKKAYLGPIFSIYLLFTLISGLFGSNVRAGIEPKKIYIKSVKVMPGDTIWTIAEDYDSVYYPSTDLYVDAIKECNHLFSYEIKVGTYLIVPYTK